MRRYVVQLLGYTRYRLNDLLVANDYFNWWGRGEGEGIAVYANIQFLKQHTTIFLSVNL